MSVMILDAGNSIIKAKIVRREMGEIAFPHEPCSQKKGEKVFFVQADGLTHTIFQSKSDPPEISN